MTEIIVIVAVAQNNAIGKNNDIPWHIKEDFQHFKEKTAGHPESADYLRPWQKRIKSPI